MTDFPSLRRPRSAALVLLGLGPFLVLISEALPSSGADNALGASASSPAAGPAPSAASVLEPAARFPYDPVCAWGRVADGRGLIVRCLEAGEAQRLAQAAGTTAAPPAAPTTSGAAPPSLTGAPAASAASPSAPAAAPARRVVVTDVGQAKADTGELREAAAQLRRPLDRYVRCVEDNGGLEAPSGQVTLRFLVRERGRAEGVLVKERRGVSVAAAKCVADVVDRRYVGYPAAPIVGATLSIAFGLEGTAR